MWDMFGKGKKEKKAQDLVINRKGELMAYHGHDREIILPGNVVRIGSSAFCGTAVEKLTAPEGLTKIDEYAFCASDLTEIVLPSTLKRIGNKAFSDCRNLKYVRIPESVTEIGDDAFSNSGLTEIDLPEEMKYIGKSVFENCSGLRSIKIPKGITEIGDDAFFASGITEISLPSTLKKIGNRAFDLCHDLKRICIPGSVTEIGEAAFSGTGITGIILPDQLKELGAHAFSKCIDLKEIRIPEGIRAIREETFANSGIVKIDLPAELQRIGERAFYNCQDLDTVRIPEGVTEIAKEAFSGSRVINIILPTTLKRIGDSAFLNCAKLRRMNLRALESVEIGKRAFVGCKKLVNEAGFLIIQNRLYAFKKKKKDIHGRIDIPDNVTFIENGIFTEYESDFAITIPLNGPSWTVKDGRPSSSIIEKCDSTLLFRNTDGTIAAKVVIPTLRIYYSPFRISDLQNTFIRSIRCRENGSFDFAAYDSCYAFLTQEEDQLQMAMARIQYPFELSEEMEKKYRSILRKNSYKLGKRHIDQDELSALIELEQINILDPEVISKLLTYAQKQRKYDFAAELIDYNNRVYGEKNVLQSLKLPND